MISLILERFLPAAIVLGAVAYLSRRVWLHYAKLASPRRGHGPCGPDCGCE